MGRQRSPDRRKAYDIFKEHGGNIENRRIAEQLKVSEKTISGWKAKDSWLDKLNGVLLQKIKSTPKVNKGDSKKRGAPEGNHNATGHGAPIGNQNARIHGLFSKYMPKDSLEIYNAIDDVNPLDLLWHQVKIAYTSILKAQMIMDVTGKDEMIKELKKKKWHATDTTEGEETEWEFQFAWDRQATFLQSQAKAQAELRNLLKQYDEMLHKNWELATEEQRTRIDLMKAQIDRQTGSSGGDELGDDWIDAVLGDGDG